MYLVCTHCGHGEDLVVREIYEFPVVENAAYKDIGEPWQEVWCNRCNQSLGDTLGVEYTDAGFVVTEFPF